MESVEPSSLLLRGVAASTAVLLALTDQYAAALAALAAYTAAWLLVREPTGARD